MGLKVGVTGTRFGMTEAQKKSFTDLVRTWDIDELHHGDCVGVDDQAANIVNDVYPNTKIICHPPKDEEFRAFNNKHNQIRDQNSHFARNRNIVDECELLVVIPLTNQHQDRGGTWYTHDYAVRQKVDAVIVWPDGSYNVVR